ncbi:MAG TPA: hypothetical protein VKH17_07495 [Acidimicrobiia bacterium]|nr:hypothetical protein [Acidimicrobiia bacterium]
MQDAASPRGGRARSRSTRVRSWSSDVHRVSVDERTPQPVMPGKFFADEDDAGRRSWEALVTVPGCLEGVDVDHECTLMLELEDGRRVRGRAVTEREQADTTADQTRYLFVGTGALTLFDWSVLDEK